MDTNGAELVMLGDRLFSKKAQLDHLHQIIAEAMYPERANFTRSRTEGDEYADMLYESVPAQNRRDLAGAIGAILRPRGKEWFKPSPSEDWRKTDQALQWCDMARDTLRRLLYSDRSRFQKTMSDADDDFVSFGNAVPILTETPERNGFLFELTHLRDNAWTSNRYGEVDVNHRKMKMTLRAVKQRWGDKALTPSQLKIAEKSPYEEIEIRHVCMPAEDFDPYMSRRKWQGKPYASIYLNPEGRHIIQQGGYWEFPYLHRRWRVPDDSVYGYSPASMLGLVDARVLQSQARVILDAGELRVAPPLIAKRDAVLGGVNNYAGAVTWVDMEYDERLGDAIRPLDAGGDVRIGLDMKVDTRSVLSAAWYLNKLSLPSDKEMTAYETSERVAEYIRSAGPIFEPFEADNARTLDAMFSMALRLGYFGPMETIPPEIRGGEIKWDFDTPVQQAYKRVKVSRAQETMAVLQPMLQIDPTVKDNFDLDKIARDTAENIGGEAAWRRPVEAVKQDRDARAQQMQQLEDEKKQQMTLDAADKGAGAAQKAAGALQNAPQLMAQLQQMLGGQGQQQAPPDPTQQYPQPGVPLDDMGIDTQGLDDATSNGGAQFAGA